MTSSAGGPPPDGIPPIDQPRFESVDEVTWLGDTDPVLSLTVDGETRGYPVAIMTWHEIVNDEIAGTPVAVTYCPLCNSGVAFHRVVDGQRLDFGTSGMLYADNLVMYDRQTQSLWPQLTGLASVGAMTGTQLEAIPMGAVGWTQFTRGTPGRPACSPVRPGTTATTGPTPTSATTNRTAPCSFPSPEGPTTDCSSRSASWVSARAPTPWRSTRDLVSTRGRLGGVGRRAGGLPVARARTGLGTRRGADRREPRRRLRRGVLAPRTRPGPHLGANRAPSSWTARPARGGTSPVRPWPGRSAVRASNRCSTSTPSGSRGWRSRPIPVWSARRIRG